MLSDAMLLIESPELIRYITFNAQIMLSIHDNLVSAERLLRSSSSQYFLTSSTAQHRLMQFILIYKKHCTQHYMGCCWRHCDHSANIICDFVMHQILKYFGYVRKQGHRVTNLKTAYVTSFEYRNNLVFFTLLGQQHI